MKKQPSKYVHTMHNVRCILELNLFFTYHALCTVLVFRVLVAFSQLSFSAVIVASPLPHQSYYSYITYINIIIHIAIL